MFFRFLFERSSNPFLLVVRHNKWLILTDVLIFPLEVLKECGTLGGLLASICVVGERNKGSSYGVVGIDLVCLSLMSNICMRNKQLPISRLRGICFF